MVCTALRRIAMIDDVYRLRLQSLIQDAAAKAKTGRAGGLGINALSSKTSVVLAQYKERGFPAAMIQRWHQGNVKEELQDDTLARLGLFFGLSSNKSTAKRLLLAYLEGADNLVSEEGEVIAGSMEPVEGVEGVRERYILDALAHLDETALLEVMLASLSRLASLLNRGSEEMKPAITRLIDGWLARFNTDVAGLAIVASIPVSRIEEIRSGGDPSDDELEQLALAFSMLGTSWSAQGLKSLIRDPSRIPD